jgi:transcriptional antiterminator RfaH
MFWSVALTKPQGEHTAASNLLRQGFNFYLPRYLSKLTRPPKIKVLFPRYIFIQIESQWHSINSTLGISRLLLTTDAKPAQVQDQIINDLKSREDEKGFIKLPEPRDKVKCFEKGQQVVIAGGTFQGYNALFDGLSNNGRVRVLIELLGRQVPLQIGDDGLQVVTAVAISGTVT